jgi:UDP-N-acetylmuramate--alanine ligase
MGQALTLADVAVVTDVYPAREQPIQGVTGELVANAAKMESVHYVPDRAELEDAIASMIREGDVLITLGAGDVTRVGRNLVDRFASRS